MTQDIDDFLAHFGVKGMRWGVRKEYKPVGRESGSKAKDETARQKAEYDAEAKRIQKALKANGIDDRRAAQLKAKYGVAPQEEPTSGLSKNQKIAIGIGVGVGVAALGYAAYKGGVFDSIKSLPLYETNATAYSKAVDGLSINWHEGVDLKAGSILKRVSTVAEKEVRADGFFACFRDGDVESYKAILPTFWPMWGVGTPVDGGYINHYKAAAAVRAPSGEKTFEIFKDLIKNTSNFDTAIGVYNPDIGNASDEVLKGLFKQFSASWIDGTDQGVKYFFDRIKSEGYNALIDFNDAGTLGKTPLRVIDSSIYEIVKNERLDLAGMLAAAKAWTPDLVHSIERLGLYMYDDEDVEDFLAHYGVKGMKWGKRKAARAEAKAARKQRNEDIMNARARVASRQAKLDAALLDASYAQSPEIQKKANRLVTKYTSELVNNMDDLKTSEKLTTGEKWASGLAIGLSAVAIAGYGAAAVGYKKSFI